MKSLIFFSVILAGGANLSAQNNVGIGTQTPHASALLDVSSTIKGLLAPRMTTAQRTAIASPAKGLLVYDTDVNSLYHYNGSDWTNLSGGGGGLTLPFAATPGIAGVAFKIDNTGRAIEASSTSTSQPAISGSSTAIGGYGVSGSNNEASGFGIAGFSLAGTGVYGFSAGAGTALRGLSSSGYGLLVSGNLRLTGGNTNPVAGAVLTSVDASGNAVWKPNPKVAFRASGVHTSLRSIPINTFKKVHFASESYDYDNNFLPTTSASPTAAMSTFVVPVTGVYHFEVGVGLQLDDLHDDFTNIWLDLIVSRSGNNFSGLRYVSPCCNILGWGYDMQSSTEIRLLAGDMVHIEISHDNDDNVPALIDNISVTTYFTGRLVVQD